MNQWFDKNINSLIHSRAVYLPSYKAVIITKKSNHLAHYGVPGQKWGVITKEYEPVAVDHRKLRGSATSQVRTHTYPRSVGSSVSRKQEQKMRKLEREGYYKKDANGRTVWHQNGKEYSPSEKRQKIVKRALIAAGVTAAVLATYGAIKYHQVQRNKAYAGILNRFMNQNPDANIGTDSGRALLQKGLNLADTNSSSRAQIKITNRYLKSKGLSVNRKQAAEIYKQGKNANKLLQKAQRYKRSRVRQFLVRHGLRMQLNIGGA